MSCVSLRCGGVLAEEERVVPIPRGVPPGDNAPGRASVIDMQLAKNKKRCLCNLVPMVVR
jgi:hypothetical protein